MKRTILTTITAAALLALTACGSAEPTARATGEPASEQPGASTGSDEMMGEEAAAEQVEEPYDGVEGARAVHDGTAIFAFGDEATYPTGKGMKVSYVEETTLSEYGAAECSTGDPVSVFKVTATNDDSGMWEPYMDMAVAAFYTDSTGEQVEASDVFDQYGSKDLDAGQSMPRLTSGKSGSSYFGFCHEDGDADSVVVYGSFLDEYGESAGDALWADAGSELLG